MPNRNLSLSLSVSSQQIDEQVKCLCLRNIIIVQLTINSNNFSTWRHFICHSSPLWAEVEADEDEGCQEQEGEEDEEEEINSGTCRWRTAGQPAGSLANLLIEPGQSGALFE